MTPIAAAAAWGGLLACTPAPGSSDVSPPVPAPVTPDTPPVTGDTGDTGDGGDTDVPVVTEPLYWLAADNGAAMWSCGLVSDGTVRCWGSADYAEEPSGTEIFTQISVGIFQACGLVLDGSVRCWGIDLPEWYEGTDILREVPVGGVYTRVDVGHATACAQDAGGALTCWGDEVSMVHPPASTKILRTLAAARASPALPR